MDLTYVLNHIGYVFCFWGVWKSLDVVWNLVRADAIVNSLFGRQSEVERQVAGKLGYYNKIREKDEQATRKMITDLSASVVAISKKLTPGMDDNLRSTVYGLYERLKLATDGLGYDRELAKEVEKLRKKIHELNKTVGEPTPCYLPVNPVPQAVEVKVEKDTPAKRTRKRTAASKKKTEELKEKLVSPAAKSGSKAEPLRYSVPHPQVMLQSIKEEGARVLLGQPARPYSVTVQPDRKS